MPIILRWMTLLLIVCTAWSVQADTPGTPTAPNRITQLNLAISAYMAPEKVRQQYQPLADYLSEKLPNCHVNLQVLNALEIQEALDSNQLDLLMVNPVLFQIVRSNSALNGAIATVQKVENDQIISMQGGVVIAHAGRGDLSRFDDLEGHRVGVIKGSISSAYAFSLFEAVQAGVSQDKLKLVELGNNDEVLQAVLTKQVDFGFIRTGVLEQWQQQNGLPDNLIKVIQPRNLHNYPYQVSTTLYPEWPFVVLNHVDASLTKQITVALLNLEPSNPVAVSAKIAGFTAPLDYLPVENLLRDLRMPPFDAMPAFNWQVFWHQYDYAIVLSGIFISVIGFILIRMYFLNRKLVTSIQQVKAHELALNYQHQRDAVMLRLPHLIKDMSEEAFLKEALSEVAKLTHSEIACIRYLGDETHVHYGQEGMQAPKKVACHWFHDKSRQSVLSQVTHPKPSYQDMEASNVWQQAISSNEPIIQNNCHVVPSVNANILEAASCYLVVPVVEQKTSVMALLVGNKRTDYTQTDSQTVQLLANEIWRLIQRHRSSAMMLAQQRKYERLVNEIGENYCLYSLDVTGKVTFISESARVIFEMPAEEIVGQSWEQVGVLSEEEYIKAQQKIQAIVSRSEPENSFELTLVDSLGKPKNLQLIQHATLNEQGQVVSIDGWIQNISSQTRAENELRQAASVFSHAQEAILITDPVGVILNVNRAFEMITGYTKKEAVGQTPKLLYSGKQDKSFYSVMWQQLLTAGKWSGEIWNKRKNGNIYPEKLTITAIKNANGSIKNFIALFSDITVEKEQRNQLEMIAHYDVLTGLPNRMLFADRLSQAIARSKRHGSSIAVVFIDLDGFKAVNDVFGHQAGDYLLKTIAKRFKNTLREEDSISRYGGDEFVAVISNVESMADIDPLLARFLVQANEPIDYSGEQLNVSASVGVTIYHHEQELEAEQIIRQADQAMYQAKTRGKNQVYLFDQRIHQAESTSQVSELKQAIKQNDLVLYYQPKLNLRKGQVHGVEALVRWNHPVRGLLQPGEFVALFQHFELVFDAGFWVIETALKQMTEWLNQGVHLSVSVNIDGALLMHTGFVERLKSLLVQYSEVKPDALVLEILETSSIEDIVSTNLVMKACSELGVLFSLDDFGTGFASLSYLKSLPVHELKADQTFVKDLQVNAQSLSIMESIIGMGNAFNLDVVAEGIETDFEANLLLKLGYDLFQGYAFCRPIPADQILAWIEQWQPKSYWANFPLASEAEAAMIAMATSHRAWVAQVEAYLFGHTKTRATYPIEQCKFILRLNQHEKNLPFTAAELQEVRDLHRVLHQAGEDALNLKEMGKEQEARQAFQILKTTTFDFLDRIDFSQKF